MTVGVCQKSSRIVTVVNGCVLDSMDVPDKGLKCICLLSHCVLIVLWAFRSHGQPELRQWQCGAHSPAIQVQHNHRLCARGLLPAGPVMWLLQ